MRASAKNIIVLIVVVLCFFAIVLILPKLKQAPVTESVVPVSKEIPTHESPTTTTQTRSIGTSVEGRSIDAYAYGTGDTEVLFVGGMHGGYEWNSVLLAYAIIDYIQTNPSVVPKNLRITIIPSLNPDGLYNVVGKEGRFVASDILTGTSQAAGRFNARKVDLNRNFDCKWKPESMWRGTVVSAGTSAFSEPEAVALRNFVLATNPKAVVFWHSKANAVYASECMNGILPETRTLMTTYAEAASYPSIDTFDAYPITGDAEGWLASINIPAITVELSTHETIEWEKNLLGFTALLSHYTSAQ